MSSKAPSPILFITGAGTAVGKTVFAACWIRHLRAAGRVVQGLKPIATGDRMDGRRLRAANGGEPSLDEVNPRFFRKACAPLVAARWGGKKVGLAALSRCIRERARGLDALFVEGVGGVEVPLEKGVTVGDWIQRLGCDVVVVAANQLGAVNHTLLSVKSLQARGVRVMAVVMVDQGREGWLERSNRGLVSEFLPGVPVYRFPRLSRKQLAISSKQTKSKIVQKTLAGLSLMIRFTAVPTAAAGLGAGRKKVRKSVDSVRESRVG
jgi:dethiobiotin synthetase